MTGNFADPREFYDAVQEMDKRNAMAMAGEVYIDPEHYPHRTVVVFIFRYGQHPDTVAKMMGKTLEEAIHSGYLDWTADRRSVTVEHALGPNK